MRIDPWTIAFLVIAFLFALASPLVGGMWLVLAVLNEYVSRAF